MNAKMIIKLDSQFDLAAAIKLKLVIRKYKLSLDLAEYLLFSYKYRQELAKASFQDLREVLEAKLEKNLDPLALDLEFERLYSFSQERGIKACLVDSASYPFLLRQIDSRPIALFYLGTIDDLLLRAKSLAIIGSRKNTSYGAMITREIIKRLKDLKLVTVSGLALGIDSIAHAESLKQGISTVAVLANGVDLAYPRQNASIYEEICQKGLVLSEYLPQTPVQKYHFPARNRIISGLAKALLITEAGPKSGTMITANFAAEQNREVFVVPGAINSRLSLGSNLLLSEGARFLARSEDFLDLVELVEGDLFDIY